MSEPGKFELPAEGTTVEAPKESGTKFDLAAWASSQAAGPQGVNKGPGKAAGESAGSRRLHSVTAEEAKKP